ncbi:hypothetical protein JW872_01255 [Candidatus Babeliales bacterium]|nr:hypothetical protein [Candidatus Babeliales bacterium]
MKYKLTLFYATTMLASPLIHGEQLIISKDQARNIGYKIWQNECGGKEDNLTFWHQAEEFPSLGIGHFIWCPQGTSCPFSEGFPLVLSFMQNKGISLPSWLTPQTPCPWKTRDAFMRDFNSKRMKELRVFLKNTFEAQAAFIVQRMIDAVPIMIESLPRAKRAHIKQQFYRVAQAPNGIYALVDYVNFKGIGIKLKEQYHGHGWGLLQILQKMNGINTKTALQDFVTNAKDVLQERVVHAPPTRNEQQFIPGWFKRLDTYLT